ncbi:hypothetical protein RR48_13954 [Papilio machaon]|uniref:Uncharacterized protein n=1 Tax=Papilio machaon TaxID=76193 RepID=A0A194RH00_PAPMA|nr:hypothetical protein RR48_13954 [Papilio machaon]
MTCATISRSTKFTNILLLKKGIRDVSDRLPVPRAVADLHDPLGAAGAPLAPAVAGEAEREEQEALRDVQAGVVRAVQDGPPAPAAPPAAEEGLGLAGPRALRRPPPPPAAATAAAGTPHVSVLYLELLCVPFRRPKSVLRVPRSIPSGVSLLFPPFAALCLHWRWTSGSDTSASSGRPVKYSGARQQATILSLFGSK